MKKLLTIAVVLGASYVAYTQFTHTTDASTTTQQVAVMDGSTQVDTSRETMQRTAETMTTQAAPEVAEMEANQQATPESNNMNTSNTEATQNTTDNSSNTMNQ